MCVVAPAEALVQQGKQCICVFDALHAPIAVEALVEMPLATHATLKTSGNTVDVHVADAFVRPPNECEQASNLDASLVCWEAPDVD